MSTPSMSDHDPARIVASALAMALLGEGQGPKWTSLPEVVIDGSTQVTRAGSPGFVGADREAVLGRSA